MRRTIFLLCWSFLLTPGWAWNEPGHRAVALVAEHNLPEPVKAWIVKTLTAHPSPTARSISDAAPWPDKVRRDPRYHHGVWHYQNISVFLDGKTRKLADSGEALRALNEQTRILKDPQSSAEKKAIALSWVIHIVGDVHQPLHAVNGFSKAFPDGDRGGNSIEVRVGDKKINLHAFWDSCAGLLLPATKGEQLDTFVAGLMAEPPDTALVAEKNPAQWIDESYKLAKNHVYKGLPANGLLTASYIEQAQKIGKSRIALAGFRLAEYLERIYSSTSKSSVSSNSSRTSLSLINKLPVSAK